MTQNIKFTQPIKENNISKHRKEKHFFKELKLLAIQNKEIIEIASLRFYQPKYNIYACLWLNSSANYGCYTSGSGVARGGGYCKQSASAAYAIENAGFELSEVIDGRGIQAVEDALIAIGLFLGFKRLKVVTSHA